MRIVCISDTHLFHVRPKFKEQIKIPEGDLLIHAGDGTLKGQPVEVMLWMAWMASLPHPNKVFIAGNHDFLFQKNPTLARSMIPPGIIYLEDNMKEVAGLKIYGTPWTPWFLNWAFNARRGPRMREKLGKIPDGIDILITHGPPLGILDQVPDGPHVGCEDLMKIIRRTKPRLNIFGHIHHSGPGIFKTPDTSFVNAAVMGEDTGWGYEPNSGPVIVIDL